MKLLIKQRVFSWTDTYDVYDEREEAKYFVKAQFFSLGHQIHVYDKSGKEVGAIREKLLKLLPKFEIEIHGKTVGMIQKEFTFFRSKYSIDCNGWRVEGDFLEWEYDILEGSSPVIHISKEIYHWGDTYMLDFTRPEDELMGLLIVIAIDAANCSKDR